MLQKKNNLESESGNGRTFGTAAISFRTWERNSFGFLKIE